MDDATKAWAAYRQLPRDIVMDITQRVVRYYGYISVSRLKRRFKNRTGNPITDTAVLAIWKENNMEVKTHPEIGEYACFPSLKPLPNQQSNSLWYVYHCYSTVSYSVDVLAVSHKT